MSLSFEHAFVVKAPADRVFSFLIDPYRVAPALPGATITDKMEDGSYSGAITIKVGPITARYRGKARFDAVDAASRTVQIVASGQDTSGRGGADMRMNGRVVEKSPGETEVTVTSDLNVTGVLAQFGRGMIQDVSNEMFKKFSETIRIELEKQGATQVGEVPAPAAAPEGAAMATPGLASALSLGSSGPAAPASAPLASAPIDAVSLGGQVVGRAAARALRRPGVWAAIVFVLLAVYWIWFR
jgi:uncharacterized protein